MLNYFLLIFSITLIVLSINFLFLKIKNISIILLFATLIFFIILFNLPKADGYWEIKDIDNFSIDYKIEIPDNCELILKQKISKSKWLWTENQGNIKLIVKKKP